tara:strand:- start:44 stop:232 length:189 start_codon:yes stop_codon:yes gene_type:complete
MECFEQKKYYSRDKLVEYENEEEYYENEIIDSIREIEDRLNSRTIRDIKKTAKKLQKIESDL